METCVLLYHKDYTVGLVLLAAIYLLGSANAKMVISLLVVLAGIISIIKPLRLIGINNRVKGLGTLVIGIVVLFISATYLPQSTQTLSNQATPPAVSLNPAEFKAQSVTISYDDLARQTENYLNKKVTFTGQVVQIEEASNSQIIMRVNATKDQYGVYTNTIWVNYSYKQGEKRFLENDIVNLWGAVKGRKTYTSALHIQVTIPEINASIIEISGTSNT